MLSTDSGHCTALHNCTCRLGMSCLMPRVGTAVLVAFLPSHDMTNKEQDYNGYSGQEASAQSDAAHEMPPAYTETGPAGHITDRPAASVTQASSSYSSSSPPYPPGSQRVVAPLYVRS